MSDYWTYTLLLGPAASAWQRMRGELVALLERHEATVVNPQTGDAVVWGLDGTRRQLPVREYAEAMFTEGAAVQVWSGDCEFLLQVDKWGESEGKRVDSLELADGSAFGSCRLSFNAYYLGEPEFLALIHAVSLELIAVLNPMYGYCCSDSFLERFAGKWNVHSALSRSVLPDVLFWFQYLGPSVTSYANRLESLGASLAPYHVGVIAAFAAVANDATERRVMQMNAMGMEGR